MRCFVLLLLAAGAVGLRAPVAAAEPRVVTSKHYTLHYEGTERQAAEASRVLEAAWGEFEEFFRGTPSLKEGERLTVRFYATQEAWAAGIRAGGARPPSKAGGYYWPPTRTAYLFRQPTVYFSRTLLIHEAAHQFHFLTRTRNRNPRSGWYTEGVAEFLSWHQWDGANLALGVIPGVSLKDYPAAALKEVAAKGFDLGAIVSGATSASRPVSWALFRYLATGKDGDPLPRFGAFRKKMDHGGQARPLFQKYFGRPDRLQPKFQAWLSAHQTPWAPVFNEWEQVAPAKFRGYARVVTACRLKAPTKHLKARLMTEGRRRWRGGLLLHWTSAQDYTVALLSAWGSYRIDRRRDGAWKTLARGRLPKRPAGAFVQLEARREADKVALRVDGQAVGAWTLPGQTMGLCLERGDLRFHDLAWN